MLYPEAGPRLENNWSLIIYTLWANFYLSASSSLFLQPHFSMSFINQMLFLILPYHAINLSVPGISLSLFCNQLAAFFFFLHFPFEDVMQHSSQILFNPVGFLFNSSFFVDLRSVYVPYRYTVCIIKVSFLSPMIVESASSRIPLSLWPL